MASYKHFIHFNEVNIPNKIKIKFIFISFSAIKDFLFNLISN